MRLTSILVVAGLTAGLIAAAASTAPSFAKDKKDDKNTWAEGIPIVTEWDAAIEEAKTTGKLLLIYNGWEREKV